MISLSLLVSKYAWALILIGVIGWFTYMALKKPNKDNPEKLSRLGLAIEKAKPIFENFQRNVAESYGPKETKAEQPKVIDAEVVKTKEDTFKYESVDQFMDKKNENKDNPFETKPTSVDAMFKPIDFTF
jgi:hypothetical protein